MVGLAGFAEEQPELGAERTELRRWGHGQIQLKAPGNKKTR
jgi:hypothetical protein